jgi:hypothetical protein
MVHRITTWQPQRVALPFSPTIQLLNRHFALYRTRDAVNSDHHAALVVVGAKFLCRAQQCNRFPAWVTVRCCHCSPSQDRTFGTFI